jgi:hypothetical protein
VTGIVCLHGARTAQGEDLGGFDTCRPCRRAWLVTHDLDTPARALYRSLSWRQIGRGPLGWHEAERVVLAAELRPA